MRDFITVVSGLPRSGTSMMMNMLASGGLPVAVDNERTADEDNPKGYFELERVKEIARDVSWIDATRGGAVKMVSMLLFKLPAAREYRVLFMRRDLDEILASQRVMLARKGERSEVDEGELRRLFATHLGEVLEWVRERPGMRLLEVAYRDVLEEPLVQARRIDEFLGGGLDVEAMAATVDRSLHRQRGAPGDARSPAESGAGAPAVSEADQEKIERQLRSLGYL